MPNENNVFTPSSILFRPHHKLRNQIVHEFVVEAPGTAPGSEWFISHVIYRHSRLPDPLNIGFWQPFSIEFAQADRRIGGPIRDGTGTFATCHVDKRPILRVTKGQAHVNVIL